ncbi:hypothetical protein AWB81_07905 [Caballeronia arationis]|jgi:hypothetical protein|nr:hypothetical protein AWB81_07905 [Caballeronia arationis]
MHPNAFTLCSSVHRTLACAPANLVPCGFDNLATELPGGGAKERSDRAPSRGNLAWESEA